MKKVLIICCLITALFSCSDKRGFLSDGVVINGTVKYPVDGGKVVLEKLDFQSAVRVDSVEMDGNTFSFQVSAAEQSFYRINIYDKQFVPFIIGLDDKNIEITADGNKASGAFAISGSLATAQKDEADSIVRRFTQKIKSLQQEAVIARSTRDDQLWLSVNERMRIAETKKDIELKKLVWENAPSVSAVYILNYINFEKDFSFVDSVATKFQEKLPESPYTIALASKMEQAREIMRLKELEVKVGDIAPEIELPDANGNMVSLTSLRGKYVLIDFWASWCRPCRAENPNVKKVYATYADKGFEILGVSLDVNSNKWKQAIEVDGLPWEHVLDTRSAESASATYNVQTIPATFLVDPEGKIIAKGLRGISLRTKLQEIFG